jgi:hypothetical protein
MSFVPEASTVAQNQAAQQANLPSSYNAPNPSSAPFGSPQNQFNPYSPPTAGQGYGYPQMPGPSPAGTTSSDASSAMTYAILGFFCCGPIFGFLAISKAQTARAIIARSPGMQGMSTANAAYYLGWADIILWAVGFFLRFAMMGAQHHR